MVARRRIFRRAAKALKFAATAGAKVPKFIKRGFDGFYSRGWLVLFTTMLMWAANVVAGKLAVGQISPMTLVSMRWLIVCVIMFFMVRGRIGAELPKLKPFWPLLLIGGAFGFTGFNALFYLAAHHTNGVNISIIQGAIPVFTLLGAFLVYGSRFSAMQVIGLMLTLAGVVLVAAKGDFSTLAKLQFNIGDVELLIACVFYSTYILALRNRPEVSGLGLFAVMAGIAFVTAVPLALFEVWQGDFFWPTPFGMLILLYVALFPSLISQVFFMRGVELIGPARAGLFANLLPVLGAILSIVFLGEQFGLYHAIALGLVLGGIYTAERLGVKA